MKASALSMLFIAVACLAPGAGPSAKPEVRPATKAVKPVRSYHDVLAVIPRELEPENARHWSPSEKNVANILFKKKLVDTKRPAVLRFKVHGVDAWPALTVWSHLPADEGYAIRVFVGQWKEPDCLPKLATLKAGDLIEMSGTCDVIKFESLWNTDSLSICLRDGSFTKLLPNGKPAPTPAKINVNIISAVYGSGDKFADVSDRVKSLIDEPGALFAAKPHWLGADPTPGWNKALVIVHEFEGKRRLFSCGEGGSVSAALLTRHKTKD